MYRMRLWSVRNARWLSVLYNAWEKILILFHPVYLRIGYERLDRFFLAVEKPVKGFLFDSRSCGQCTLGDTGMSCPMNCPKSMRNGPCGGVRPDGKCEVKPDMPCVWVLAWEGNRRMNKGTNRPWNLCCRRSICALKTPRPGSDGSGSITATRNLTPWDKYAFRR